MEFDPDGCRVGIIELRGRITARRGITGCGPVPQQMHRMPQLAASEATQYSGVGSLPGAYERAYEKPGTFDRTAGTGNYPGVST